MSKSLLFLPDISGFTEFVQTTEVAHSQHVIAELLEILVEANTQDLQLAEIEGDALFFYKEEELLSMEKLLAQVETMFTAFYSHLKLLETNRICPCKACSTAPNLQLKIIAHSGEIQFITVQGKRKPFGTEVIQVHRLMKNSVNSDNYVLLSEDLVEEMNLPKDYKSMLFEFTDGQNEYDGKQINYFYSVIQNEALKLKPFSQAKKVQFNRPPSFTIEKTFPIPAADLFEYITNFTYRHHWVQGADEFLFDENEVNRTGTEHICVINDKHLNFITVTKQGEPGQLVYGEHTTDVPFLDESYQFYILTPLTHHSVKLEMELYLVAKSPLKKLMSFLFVKNLFRKNASKSVEHLLEFVSKNEAQSN